MKKISTVLACIMFLFVVSCSNNESQEKTSSKKQITEEFKIDLSERPADNKGRFIVEKGMIEFETKTLGMKQNMTMYFADYGEKVAVEIKGNFMGIKTHNINLVNNGEEYEIDMLSKTVVKKEDTEEMRAQDIDFTALNDDMMKELNLTYEGKETFMDKNCDKFSIDNKQMKTKGYYLVWQGIPLKTDLKAAGFSVEMIAKTFDFESPIADDIFEVPQGFTFTEK